MRIDFKFRHLPHSDELTAYVADHIDKLQKYEMKPVRAEITFTHEKTSKRVDIHVRGEDIEMHAHADGEDFFHSVDQAIAKIGKQLAKKKSKVQAHKGAPHKVS